MKLRFLGQPYSRSQTSLETISSDCTVCYRGQKYHLRVPAESLAKGDRSKLSISIRKYRGVSYIVEHRNPAPPKQKQREFCHQ